MAFEKQIDPIHGDKRPVCMHLRTKGMYVRGELVENAEHSEGSSHCWCNQTQRVMGPDSLDVFQHTCNSDRTCYESRF